MECRLPTGPLTWNLQWQPYPQLPTHLTWFMHASIRIVPSSFAYEYEFLRLTVQARSSHENPPRRPIWNSYTVKSGACRHRHQHLGWSCGSWKGHILPGREMSPGSFGAPVGMATAFSKIPCIPIPPSKGHPHLQAYTCIATYTFYMYICIDISIYMYMYMSISIYIRTNTHVRNYTYAGTEKARTCTCMYIYVCMYMHIYIYMRTCQNMCRILYVYICIKLCICIYVYMHKDT